MAWPVVRRAHKLDRSMLMRGVISSSNRGSNGISRKAKTPPKSQKTATVKGAISEDVERSV